MTDETPESSSSPRRLADLLPPHFSPTVRAGLASYLRVRTEVDRLETEMRALGTPQADLDWFADLCGGFVWTYREGLQEMKRHVINGKDPIAQLRIVVDQAGLGTPRRDEE